MLNQIIIITILILSPLSGLAGFTTQSLGGLSTEEAVLADYKLKPDFQDLEANNQLTFEDLKDLTAEDLNEMNQEELDQLYALSTAGPIPQGRYDGTIVVAKGGPVQSLRERFSDSPKQLIFSNLKGIGEFLWKGKIFNKQDMVLQNRITIAPFTLGLGFTVAKYVLYVMLGKKDEAKYASEKRWFPAKLFCGPSLLDSRRESIIIDYAYSDTIKGIDPNGSGKLPYYDHDRDKIVTREGFKVRDEIRMVRPGLYLGRAYMGHLFLLNFVLYNEKVATELADWKEDCSTGEQTVSIERPKTHKELLTYYPPTQDLETSYGNSEFEYGSDQ